MCIETHWRRNTTAADGLVLGDDQYGTDLTLRQHSAGCQPEDVILPGTWFGLQFHWWSPGGWLHTVQSGPSLVLLGWQCGEGGAHICDCVPLFVWERGRSPGFPKEASAPSRRQPLCPQPPPGGSPPDCLSHAVCHCGCLARCVAAGCSAVPGSGGAHAPFRIRRSQHHHCCLSGSLPGHYPPSILSDPHDPTLRHQPDHCHMGAERLAEHTPSLRLGLHRFWPSLQGLHSGVVLQLVLFCCGVHLFLLASSANHVRMLLDGV